MQLITLQTNDLKKFKIHIEQMTSECVILFSGGQIPLPDAIPEYSFHDNGLPFYNASDHCQALQGGTQGQLAMMKDVQAYNSVMQRT